MVAVILFGLQGSGKSGFFAKRFADTHVRINLDMLGTRSRESILLHACLAAQQPFVIDNTNPTARQRQRYVGLARLAGFEVHGYHLDSPIELCVERNASRPADRRVPEKAIYATANKWEAPTRGEGYDRLFRVTWGGSDVVVEEVP